MLSTIFSLIAIVAAITAVIAAYIAHRSCLVLIDRALEATRLASLAMVRISSSRASRKRYSFSSNKLSRIRARGYQSRIRVRHEVFFFWLLRRAWIQVVL